MMSFFRVLLLFLMISSFGWLSACGRIDQNQSQDAGITIELTMQPEQPAVGPARLIFTLTDEAGQPINDARLDIEGNMTHAGMAPVFAQASAGQEGRYMVPFEWTMGGDWYVTVEVSLADGRRFTRRIPVTVE